MSRTTGAATLEEAEALDHLPCHERREFIEIETPYTPSMIPLPTWMRRTLFATAVMNLLVAAAFVPAGATLRAVAGFPEAGHPFYLLTVGLFVLLFGLGYLWAAVTGRADRLFIAVAAAGKLSFVALLVGLWVAGTLPTRAPVLGMADLVFAMLFLRWLLSVRERS